LEQEIEKQITKLGENKLHIQNGGIEGLEDNDLDALKNEF